MQLSVLSLKAAEKKIWGPFLPFVLENQIYLWKLLYCPTENIISLFTLYLCLLCSSHVMFVFIFRSWWNTSVFCWFKNLDNTKDHSSEIRTFYLVKSNTGTFENRIVTSLEKNRCYVLKKLDQTEESHGAQSQTNPLQRYPNINDL